MSDSILEEEERIKLGAVHTLCTEKLHADATKCLQPNVYDRIGTFQVAALRLKYAKFLVNQL